MPLCALPDHLKANDGVSAGTGRDQDNRAQGRWRAGWTSFGWRCAPGWSWLYLPIPYTSFALPFFPVRRNWRRVPLLLIGWNVHRWIKPPQDESEVFVGQLVNRFVLPWTFRIKIEADPKAPPITETGGEFVTVKRNRLVPITRAQFHVIDSKTGEAAQTLDGYGPSPIQSLRFGFSFVLTWPLHLSVSYRRKREGKKDFILFARFGARWDSWDSYFSCPALFIGLAWN